MLHNTLAVKSLPKAIKKDEIEMEQDQQWQRVSKPEEFPNELWEYVQPDQREITVVRFNKFKDRKHLEKCIEKIVKQLDIQHREDDKYHCEWIGRDVSSHQMLLAQAVSNVDAYFFPDPEEVSMAKDVVAEINTTDEKPFKCTTRKLSVVQQAFLQAKTNIMLMCYGRA